MRKIINKGGAVTVGTAKLEEVQEFKQNQNKNALEAFLKNATVEYKGKRYGVAEEDQAEIQAMVAQYQLLSTAGVETQLEWHAKHEQCEKFTIEEIIQLVAVIKSFVLPYVSKMQEIKAKIYSATDIEEVLSIAVFEVEERPENENL